MSTRWHAQFSAETNDEDTVPSEQVSVLFNNGQGYFYISIVKGDKEIEISGAQARQLSVILSRLPSTFYFDVNDDGGMSYESVGVNSDIREAEAGE